VKELGILTPDKASTEVQRAIKRFALASVAGIMASDAGILPFSAEDISSSSLYVRDLWLPQAEELPDSERAIRNIIEFIQSSPARIPDTTDNEACKRGRDLVGFFDCEKKLYLFTKAGLRTASGGFDPGVVVKELGHRSLLHTNERDHKSIRRRIDHLPEMTRYYAVRTTILEGRNGIV